MTRQELLVMDVLSLQNLLESLGKQKVGLTGELDHLHATVKEERERVNERVEALRALIAPKQVELDSLVTQIEGRTEELKELEGKHKTAHETHGQAIAEKKEELRKLREDESKIRNDLHVLGLTMDSWKIDSTNLETRMKNLQGKVDELVETIRKMEIQLSSKTTELENLNKEVTKVQGHLDHMKNRREVLAEHILTERNANLMKVNDKLDAMAKSKRQKK